MLCFYYSFLYGHLLFKMKILIKKGTCIICNKKLTWNVYFCTDRHKDIFIKFKEDVKFKESYQIANERK